MSDYEGVSEIYALSLYFIVYRLQENGRGSQNHQKINFTYTHNENWKVLHVANSTCISKHVGHNILKLVALLCFKPWSCIDKKVETYRP